MSGPSFQYSDFVRPATREDYARAIDNRIEWLRRQPGLVTVYSIGSVGHPGISDIDLVAVFEDDAAVAEHPLDGLDPMSRYLFVHTLYGARRSDFLAAQRFSFYQNYHLLSGENLLAGSQDLPPGHRSTIERQIALEFMLRMYISLFLQREYGLLRIRTLLLHGKGLLNDARSLGIPQADWIGMLEEVMMMRDQWFTRSEAENNRAVDDWFRRFDPAYGAFLKTYLQAEPFEVPATSGFNYAKNIQVRSGKVLRASRHGFRIPFGNALLGRKYFNLQNRLNRFVFEVPFNSSVNNPLVREYYAFSTGLRDRTRQNLPGFFALTSAFQVGHANSP